MENINIVKTVIGEHSIIIVFSVEPCNERSLKCLKLSTQLKQFLLCHFTGKTNFLKAEINVENNKEKWPDSDFNSNLKCKKDDGWMLLSVRRQEAIHYVSFKPRRRNQRAKIEFQSSSLNSLTHKYPGKKVWSFSSHTYGLNNRECICKNNFYSINIHSQKQLFLQSKRFLS